MADMADMADMGAALASELTRIIDCSYPASLSELAAILAHSHVSTIRACIAACSQCAIQKLVSLVYDALPLSAHTTHTLHHLCSAPEFRDELLLLKPDLLDALLTKANSSQQDFEDYADTCVLLLSRPLPNPLPLPSSVQEFFLRVFQKSNHNPSVETLRPVYRMLNGACFRLFSLLPRDTQQQFDQQLRHILRSSDVGKDAMLLLWCFGIVLLIEYPDRIRNDQIQHSHQTSSFTYTKKDWQTASGQKLFLGSTSLYRTITLAALSVIWAIKGGVGVSDEEAREGIHIASRVLRVIDQDVRANWPKADARSKGTSLKLVEKIERIDTKSAIFLEAVSFHALIVGTNGLQPGIVTQYELCLTSLTRFEVGYHLQESLSESLPVFADHIQPSTIQHLFSQALKACLSAPSARQNLVLVTVMDELATAICTSELLRSNSLYALSATETQDQLHEFLDKRSECSDSSCTTYATSQHCRLLSATVASLLTASATASTQNGKPALSHKIVASLINKQRELNFEERLCLHTAQPVHHSQISLFQQACTPYTGQHLQDWRTRLKSELESQNHYHRDSILRSVAQICQDLETRCTTVEEPLKREQEKRREQEEHITELSRRVSLLQSQVSDDELHLQGLDNEKELLEQEKREMHDRNKHLTARLESLEAELVQSRKAAEKTLKELQETHTGRELVLQTELLKREDETRVHSAQSKEFNKKMSQMKDLLEEKGGLYRALEGQYSHLQQRLDQTEQQLHDELAKTSRLTNEYSQLQTRIFDMESQLRGTEEELELTVSKMSDLQASHQEFQKSSEDILQKVKTKYENDMEAATNHSLEEQNALQAQLQTSQQEVVRLLNICEENLRERQLLQSSISSLETRVQELTDLCSEQEDELDELRTLRRNVLASMGLGTQNPLAIRSVSRSQEGKVDPQTPRKTQHRQRPLDLPNQKAAPKVGIQSTTGVIVDTAVDTITSSSEPHTSQDGDRHPKRPKPRPSFKVPAMQTPFTQKPITASRSLSKKLSPSNRYVLKQMSPNRRHTTVGFAVGEKPEGRVEQDGSLRIRRGSLEVLEHVDFDMEEEFEAGTPLTPGNFLAGTGRGPREEETATEL